MPTSEFLKAMPVFLTYGLPDDFSPGVPIYVGKQTVDAMCLFSLHEKLVRYVEQLDHY